MQAKDLLNANNIEFKEVNIEENADAKDFVLTEGHRAVPQIYEGNTLYCKGFAGLVNKIAEDKDNV